MSVISTRERSSDPAASLAHLNEPDDTRLAVAAETFRMLADPTRLHILWLLAQAEADVTTLTEACHTSRTAVSQHLAKLRFTGLVASRRDGRRVIYTLADGHLTRLVREALNHADHQVTGEAPHD
ncbi:DNA-binding transcriptional ArsR family regulator [Gordonia terrae]